ncbi:phenylalanine--tRNA ligase subunit beta [Pelomicrobium methylotrophicum]|uniref:Phenylalanine--tRNA ligase beta subunit n=1 Tax=Pelomicrobium methylotrophicum TaxID=2602750 RepID=A0A5C7EI36_9PROT|nr:phenylalanine--tRNA ligase subunit beta [Pelomicrobium methylotrophicum]TXF11685.1 phenylalanine--tRNA ligase subunit beta [Pelomicrobium methylotrophicum]
MKFSENWLRTFVDPPLTSEELADALTMAGLEVEALEPAAPPFSGVVVGHVLAVERHPAADRLWVCRVDVGRGEPLPVVCGAPNVRAGMKAPCAVVGAKLPQLTIREAKVRGVASHGMLCSAKELGLSEVASGLMELPPEAPVGADLREALDLDDHLFTLKLTPNRGDCLSVAGIAREVAAITATSLRLPEVEPVAAGIEDQMPIQVDALEACPLYCGRVIRGVDPSVPTPDWMVQRLERSGVRSISAIVDVTNYVMLELGQPLHAFDLARIDKGIVVRFGRPGERLTLLNEQTVEVESFLIIADAAKPLALAGIMGGAGSAVSADTTDLFLEAAFFSPQAVAGKAFALGFSSESLYRFERGVDYAATRQAMERATQLILAICGGRAGPITEVQGPLPKREPIRLRVARARRVLGLDLDSAQVSGLLRRLQFRFVDERDVFYVTPHSYRFDLQIEEDLIEELARLYGYDQIPAALPVGVAAMLPDPEGWRSREALRQQLVARDYQEVVTYAFVDASLEADLTGNAAPVRLLNPIASQMSVMRGSLLGGLLQCLRFNLSHKQSRVRLFELGCCFVRENGELRQPERIAALAYGGVAPEQWGEAAREVDFFDVKADLEALFAPRQVHTVPRPHPALHPGRSAAVVVEGQEVGWIGELHPRWQQKYELPKAPVAFEVELAAVLRTRIPAARPVSKFPLVRRDIAVLVDEGVPAQALLETMRELRLDRVVEVGLFDVYRGAGLPPGKKSLAFRVLFQDTQKTLTDQEVEETKAVLVGALEQRFQAKLRI